MNYFLIIIFLGIIIGAVITGALIILFAFIVDQQMSVEEKNDLKDIVEDTNEVIF